MKKGQVTIFIVLAIVILIVIALVSYYYNDLAVSGEEISLPQDVLRFKESRDRCVEDNSALSLYLLGLQAGYYTVPRDSFLGLEKFRVVYLVDNGESKLLSLNEIKKEYYSMLDERLKDCIVYPKGMDVVVDDYDVSVSFGDGVDVSVNYKMKVKKDGMDFDLSDKLYYSYPVRFKKIHDFVQGLVEREIDEPNTQDFSYLAESGFEVDVYNMPDMAVYLVTDYESLYDEMNYLFMFGVRR